MIFYITGPDHSGKSTLANKLIKTRKANYIHCDYNKNWNLEEYHKKVGEMVETLNSYGQDVVLDRWCLDHYAYRNYNKENRYDPKDLWNEFVKKHNNEMILIFCLPANEFNSKEREEMFNESQMQNIEREFYDLFKNVSHYTYYYKTDGGDMGKFINHVMECQEKCPLDYSWKDRIEFPNFGFEKEIEDYIKKDSELSEDEEKELEGYEDYIKWFYEQQRKIDELNEKGNHSLKTAPAKKFDYKITLLSDPVSNFKENSGKHMKSTVDEKSIDYDKLPKCIAVDFDDTLVKNGFPKIIVKDENINWDLINKLKEEKKNGKKLILWTNRTGQALDDAVSFSNSYLGLVFDAINDNVQEVKDAGLNPRKIFAEIFYDDKAFNIKF